MNAMTPNVDSELHFAVDTIYECYRTERGRELVLAARKRPDLGAALARVLLDEVDEDGMLRRGAMGAIAIKDAELDLMTAAGEQP